MKLETEFIDASPSEPQKKRKIWKVVVFSATEGAFVATSSRKAFAFALVKLWKNQKKKLSGVVGKNI